MKFDAYIGDGLRRFVLGKRGTNSLAVFGINPSTADQCNSDRTIEKIESLNESWNLNGFLMFNLYPLRASSPKSLPLELDEDLLKKNVEVIRNELKKFRVRAAWAAWGDAFDKRTYFTNCLEKILSELKVLNLEWKKCEPLTKSQNPRHPLSGRPHIITEQSRLTDFSVQSYLEDKRRKHFPTQ
ncbi:MAG TPA: DUF1643 domain-containing protein [Candidatus Acidoferrum sp.]|nr:DUF1643 domain-containing protein [Candidatus Acidoferrum sp.]